MLKIYLTKTLKFFFILFSITVLLSVIEKYYRTEKIKESRRIKELLLQIDESNKISEDKILQMVERTKNYSSDNDSELSSR